MISLANLNPTGNFLFKDMSCLQYAQVLSCFVIEAGQKRKKTVEFNLAQDLSMIGKMSSFFYTDALPSYFFSPLPLAVLSFFFYLISLKNGTFTNLTLGSFMLIGCNTFKCF